MNIIWKTVRKPLIWKPLFVLSVFGFNFLMDNNQSTIAAWTFFSTIFVLCIGNINSRRDSSYVRRKSYFKDAHVQQRSYLREASDRRLINYGSRTNYSMYDRDRMFGR